MIEPQAVLVRLLREAVELVSCERTRPPTGILIEVDELHDVPNEQLQEVAGEQLRLA